MLPFHKLRPEPHHERMAEDRAMQVTLTPELEELIRRKLESGFYDDASEVIREALRLLAARDELDQLKLERLRAALIAGESSGLVEDFLHGRADGRA
jgi:antitoxin ParD1/3/4